MTADRSTVEGWLRKLETAASHGDDIAGRVYRADVFRAVLGDAWADGRERGYMDHRDDVNRAEAAQREADRAATEKEN